MVKTFRFQIFLCIFSVMVVTFISIYTIVHKEVGLSIREREVKSIKKLASVINLIAKDKYIEFIDNKVNATISYKESIKILAMLMVNLYSSIDGNNHTKKILNKWFEFKKKITSNTEFLMIDAHGKIYASSNKEFLFKNTESFYNIVSSENIKENIKHSALNPSGEFIIFSLNGTGENKIGYFFPLSDDGVVLSIIRDINDLVKLEKNMGKIIINKIKEDIVDLERTRRSCYIFIFDGKKDVKIYPPRKELPAYKMHFDYLMRNIDNSSDLNEIKLSKLNIDGRNFLANTSYFKVFDWYISVLIPEDEITKTVNNLVNNLALAIVLIFVSCILFSYYIVSRATHPLEILSKRMEKVAEHDFRNKDHSELLDSLPVSANNEIGRLAQSFGLMVDNLAVNIQQLVEKTASSERIEGELNAARNIQLGYMPKDFSFEPERKALDIHACIFPAREIGGDLYDFFFIDDNHLCFTVGDVSGKGIPAALFMVIAKKLINCNAHQQIGKISPAVMMSQINSILYKDNPDLMFITLLIGVLNVKTGHIRYANGGHTPSPIFIGSQENPYYKKELSGPLVGVIPGAVYKDIELILKPGSAIFICTDGVTEAMNENDELFGEKRLLEYISRMNNVSCKETVDKILHKVKDHSGKYPQSDDIAMLMIKWGVEEE